MSFPSEKIRKIFLDFFPEGVFYFEGSCVSTQDLIKEKISEGREILYICSSQSAGYGRFGRRFFSPPGGLWFSLYIPAADCPPDFQIAVADGIRKRLNGDYGLSLKLKKPNDILSGAGEKVAGFLVSKIFRGSEMTGFIIGVGMNVNNETDFDGVSASSLAKLVGRQVLLEEIFFICLKVIKENSPSANF